MRIVRKTKMTQHQLHGQFNSTANQGGFMPSYWSEISLGNDREPKKSGSREEQV